MKKNFSFYIRKIIFTIINFIKMLFLYVFKLITFFFPEKKKEEIKKETKANKKANIVNGTIENLPDEENTKDSNTVLLKKEEKNLLINNLFSLKDIEEMINKVLKEEFEIDIKKINKEEEKEIDKLKERILPVLIHNIEYKNIKTKDELETDTTKVINDDLKQKPLFITSNKRTKKEYDTFFPHNPVKAQKIETEKEEKKAQEETKLQEEALPFTPTIIKKEPLLNLNDEVAQRITSSSLVIANIAKEITRKKINNKEYTLDSNKQEETTPSFEEKKRSEVKLTELTTENQMEFIELLNNDELTMEQIIKIEQKMEEKKQKQEQQQESEIEEIKEKIKDTIHKTYLNSPSFEQSIEEIEANSLEEKEKEELEDKNYEGLEEQINKMLYEIELFYIKNEGKISKEQEAKLQAEKEHLQQLKDKLQREKQKDIEKDEKLFSNSIKNEEKDGLIRAIKEIQIEHQSDLDEEMLSKIEDLEKMDKKQSEVIEKRLIKKKMKKAARAASIASIASLPFIKNRFFFAFTLGLFVHNHLGFLNSIISRTTTNLEIPNLNAITNGQSAIEGAINTNYDNLELLDYLNKQAILKHPELKGDSEYQYYMQHLNTRLNKNYNKLTRKYDNLEKYHKKTKRNIKILKKKEQRTI